MMHNRSCEPERAVFDYDAMSDLIEEYLQVLRSAEKSPATIRDRGRCLRRLHADLPFGIGAACREQEHRAAQRRSQLVRLDERLGRGEQSECRPDVGFGTCLVQHLQHTDDLHARSR